jgi:hypothetical protein
MNLRKLSILTGISYLIIFVAAIFANFMVVESIQKNPLQTLQENNFIVRLGVMAFMITVVFDVIIAWTLFEMYKQHLLTILSTLFRMMHAVIMGVAIYALVIALTFERSEEILLQINIFNTIWLIGLFFFGFHLILLGNIVKAPRFIVSFLILAGSMYMIDTAAHFLLQSYKAYSDLFLAMVAIPSIIGEMSLAIWFLWKGGK